MTNKYFFLIATITFSTASVAFQNAAEIDDNVSPLDQSVPVAAEQVDSAPEPIDAATDIDGGDPISLDNSEEKLLEEFARYRRLLSDGILDEADVAAKRIVEMAIRIYGARSRETASALNNLGIVQHSNGQFDAAIQNFTSAVEIVENVEDKLNEGLVNPLKGLGAAQLAIGRPDRAYETFTRATHITHVNEGPHNMEQVEILQSIAETQLRMGDTKAARSILDRIHVLNVRFFEKDPLGLIPSLMSRARWQHRAGYYNDERDTYRRALRIVEAGGGKNDPLLIEPLRRLGESFYFIDVTSATQQHPGLITTGESYFKRAVRIAEKTDGLDWRTLIATKLSLGDYYTYTDAQNRSKRIYREVWKILSTDDERISMRDELFNEPLAMRTEQLPVFVGKGNDAPASSGDWLKGRIVVEYTVSTRGRVKNIRTTAVPPEFTGIQRMVHREVRQRAYRPMIVDGEPVEAKNQVFEHEFSYTQAHLDTVRKENNAETED